jgi:hypothetical protein
MRSTVRSVTVKDSTGTSYSINPIGLLPVSERVMGDEALAKSILAATQHGWIAILSELKKFPDFIRWIIQESFVRAEGKPSQEDIETIEFYLDGLSADELWSMGEAIFHAWFPDMEELKKKISAMQDKIAPPADETSSASQSADSASATQANS